MYSLFGVDFLVVLRRSAISVANSWPIRLMVQYKAGGYFAVWAHWCLAGDSSASPAMLGL